MAHEFVYTMQDLRKVVPPDRVILERLLDIARALDSLAADLDDPVSARESGLVVRRPVKRELPQNHAVVRVPDLGIPEGRRVGHLHLDYLNPLPRGLSDALERYERVLVAEINMGQLAMVLQGRFAIPVERLNKVQGLPFTAAEVFEAIAAMTGEKKTA